MTFRYLVLGPVRALRPDGVEAGLGGARVRALLAALAAGGGRPVSVEGLMAQIWGTEGEEGRPADGPAALQALVGRLRRAIGKEAVELAPGGYRLAVAQDDEIDLFRFERLASEGLAALEARRPAEAERLLDEGLALWRGPALADLPDAATDPLAVRAEARRAEARRGLVAGRIALGRAPAVLAEVTALAAAAPLDEPLQALRLRALAGAGRRAEALQAYEDIRTALAERLGTDPGPELRALHAELLTPHPGLPAHPDPPLPAHPGPPPPALRGTPPPALRCTPSPTSPVPGELPDPPAPEALHPLSPKAPRPPGPAAGPPPPANPRTPPRGNLRARLTSFVGRERELAELRTALVGHRLVTLLGPGGAGKTRLALESAEALAAGDPEASPDGVWVAELAPVRDGAAVAEAVLTALGAREPQLHVRAAAEAAARDPLAHLVEHCGRRRMLLVLDNCEHVVGAAAALAQRLLEECPRLTVLATSREPLGVPGEVLRPVGPLPAPTALRLLADRGAAARPGFTPDDDPDACAEICRRLDGLPLALELAAARLRMLTPRQIADRLDDRFRLLTGGSRTVLPRQQTLRAVVDWSWDLLDTPEHTVLRRLSVFAGGCALPQAEEVCGPDTLDALAALVDKSLVVAEPDGPDGMRYRLLETVAEYAAERLDEAGERPAAERRHLTAYRELVRTGEPRLRGHGQAEWLDRFETEHDNVRAALRTAVALADEQEALCLVLATGWFWLQRSHQTDARVWSAAAAALGPDPFAAPVRPAGPLPHRCTDTPPPWSGEQLWDARRGVHLTLLACDGIEDTAVETLGEASTQDHFGRIAAAYRADLPQVRRQPGSMWFFVRLMTGGYAGLFEAVNALVAACETGKGGWDLAFALLTRARLDPGAPDGLTSPQGDADRALALFEEAGDRWGGSEALATRGEEYERQGAYEKAAADYERAMRDAADIGAPAQVALFAARLAYLRLRAAQGPDERERAEQRLVAVIEESRHHGGEVVGTGRLLLARHYGATARTALAREQLAFMEDELPRTAPGVFRGLLCGVGAWLDCLDGDWSHARDSSRRALGHLDGLAYLIAPQLVAEQFLCAAWSMAAPASAEDGARLLAVYDDGDHRPGGVGFQPFDDERVLRRRSELALRAVLGDAAYERAYEKGCGLTVREAASLI